MQGDFILVPTSTHINTCLHGGSILVVLILLLQCLAASLARWVL